MSFQLRPADILIQESIGKSLASTLKRWALGSPYDHCFLYLGQIRFSDGPHGLQIPMLFESAGRGVVIQSLSRRYGQRVLVMRLNYETEIHRVLVEAITLASEPKAFYDYLCILEFILPRLIFEKLGLPIPIKWQRNPWHVCSEAIFEVCYRAGLKDILPGNRVPLPADYVYSPLLYPVWEGVLNAEVVHLLPGHLYGKLPALAVFDVPSV